MIIENSDALMAWLAAVLEPLCDADPNALSKYVVALIKKDKPEPELKDSMEQQMEVFLQENTVSFIESLFKTLESKEYLEGPPKTVSKKTEEDIEEDGKPDSTTSTPANIGELSSDLKEAEHRSTRRTSDEDRGRRRSPKERKVSSPRRRRSSGHRGRHRSRSRSPYGRRSGRSRTSPFSRRSRSRSFSPRRVGSRSPPPPRRYASRGSTPTNDEDNNTYTPSAVSTTPIKKQRCRDYDEKGFCLKGDQCKFDHGNDAVVLEDTNNPSMNSSSTYMPGGGSSAYTDPYVPASTVLPPLHLPPPGYPATHASHSRKRSYEDTGASGGSYPPNKRFDYNRLGGRGRGRGGRNRGYGGGDGGSSHVLVKNIPPGLNTIAHLNNHFAKFGTLVNVQIHYQGDHSAALVSYAQPQEASAAMNSSEAVFGNRFIKMFFNNPDRGSIKDRLGESTVNERVSTDGKTITKTIINSEAGVAAGKDSEQPSAAESLEEANAIKENKKAAAIAAIKKNQEVLEMKAKLRKEADVKKVEAVKKTEELRNSKQQLLEKLIDEQKKLILKLEEKKGCFKAEEKTAMMTLLKSLTSSIEKTKEDIKALISQQSVHPRKNISDIQKELLDAELELFNAQQDGNEEVEDIQKKVNRLKVEAAQKGLLPTSRPPRGRGGFAALRGMRGYHHRGSPFSPRGHRGRGGFRGRGRGSSTFSAFPVQTSIDRRPTTILVSDIDLQLKDAILAHLTKFGEISESIEDEDSKTLLVQFKTRREAETAMLKAKVMGDSELSLSWHSVSIGESSDVEQEEAEQSGIEEQSDLLDDYTPLDPTYLPPGLEEEGNKDSNAEPPKAEEEEEEEEEDDAERSWKR